MSMETETKEIQGDWTQDKFRNWGLTFIPTMLELSGHLTYGAMLVDITLGNPETPTSTDGLLSLNKHTAIIDPTRPVSAVSAAILSKYAIPPTEVVIGNASSPGGITSRGVAYKVKIGIKCTSPILVRELQVMTDKINILPAKVDAVIGMDILRLGHLFIDGPNQTFKLSLPE